MSDFGCSLCKTLLENMQRFFRLLEDISVKERDWLTVEEVAEELKISKSIVYRLIRAGKLQAVNISENNGKFNSKGCYRIQRSALQEYVKQNSVCPENVIDNKPKRIIRFPKVRNHLGL